jgi:hypothetical protein
LKSVHIIYTHVEPDICRGETFKETFLEPSCECCGSDEHAMLVRSTNPQHRTGFEYMCPVATYKDLDHLYPRYPINLDFYACPLKFAEIHHYTDDERLAIALDKYRTMSAAKLNYSYSQDFVDEVKRLCEEYQLNHQFKRRRISGSDDEEDAKSDQDTPSHEEGDQVYIKQQTCPQLKKKEEEG